MSFSTKTTLASTAGADHTDSRGGLCSSTSIVGLGESANRMLVNLRTRKADVAPNEQSSDMLAVVAEVAAIRELLYYVAKEIAHAPRLCYSYRWTLRCRGVFAP